jgi:hypothetical protein
MAKKLAITLEQTFITPEMSTRVEEADYIYYRVDEGVRPPKDAHYFEPDEEDMVLD